MADKELETMLLERLLNGQADIKEDISSIKQDVARNADDLEEHMRRTDALEKLHKDNETRIQELEKPKIVLSTLKKWVIGCGAIAGAILTISKFMGLF